MEAFNGKGRFSRVRRLKTPWPINTKFGTNHYRPNIMLYTNFHNNRPKGFVCPIWWSCTFSVCQFSFFFTSCHEPPPKRAGRFAKLMPQTTSFATRKCLLGSHRWKHFFRGSTPSPEFSKGILHANRKSRITFDRWEIDAKFQNRPIPNRGQAIERWLHFRSTTPLAAEIVFLPFSAITKARIPSKRSKIDGKCLQNTNRKPWSPYRLVTSLPVSNAPYSGRHRHSAMIDI